MENNQDRKEEDQDEDETSPQSFHHRTVRQRREPREEEKDSSSSRESNDHSVQGNLQLQQQLEQLQRLLGQRDLELEQERHQQARQLEQERQQQARQLEQRDLELEQERQQQARQLEQRDLELEQERQQREKLELELELLRQEQEQLEMGTYYTTISDLWPLAVERNLKLNGKSCQNNCRRTQCRIGHPTQCRHVENSNRRLTSINSYELSMEHLEDFHYNAKVNSARGGSSETRPVIWPESIYGTELDGDVAHLVPAADSAADTWWFLVPWIFGEMRPLLWNDWQAYRKAIHGVVPQEGRNRIKHTGIKHLVTNKIRLPGQAKCMDNNPCLLIVPILSSHQVRSWNGEGYSAIVVADTWENVPIKTVVRECHMLQKNRLASEDEIELSRQLLCHFLRGILCAHRYHRPEGIPLDGISNFDDQANVMFPSPHNVSGTIHVTKVTFVGVIGDPDKHPAPDPILLASRAAVTFARRQMVTLAAAAEPVDLKEFDGPHWTELDQLAAEQYLEQRVKALRPSSDFATLAKSLGQPFAASETTTPTTIMGTP
jgi:hypothetical protein